MRLHGLLVCVALLFLPGCEDTKNPLSDPKQSKPDEGLVGLWRGDDKVYYHVGHAGKMFPKGWLRVVAVPQNETDVDPPSEYLVFPTRLGDKTYLNMVNDEELVKRLDEDGWTTDAVDCYTLWKYKLDGGKLVMWIMDEEPKEHAIKSGKIKGAIEENKLARFTDTTENVARFVTEAGDGLWNTKEPGRFERVELTKRR